MQYALQRVRRGNEHLCATGLHLAGKLALSLQGGALGIVPPNPAHDERNMHRRLIGHEPVHIQGYLQGKLARWKHDEQLQRQAGLQARKQWHEIAKCLS